MVQPTYTGTCIISGISLPGDTLHITYYDDGETFLFFKIVKWADGQVALSLSISILCSKERVVVH